MIPLNDTKTSGKYPIWVLIIILINVVVFFLELSAPDPDAFIEKWALIPARVNINDYWTLVPFFTSQFLHGGFLHIISNMWFLWIFGDNVEYRLGDIFFPIFYIICGVAAAIAQYLFLPNSIVPMLGASGAIAGILGVYFAYFAKNTVKTLVPIFGFFTITDLPASIMLIYWFGTQIFAGAFSIYSSEYQSGGIAYFAHIGGFAFGFIIAKILNLKGPQVLSPYED